jgi:hypothetical protein
MTQVPIADGLLTALDGEPRMLASRCPEGLCVEARLVGFGGRRPGIGEAATLVVVPFRVDEADGDQERLLAEGATEISGRLPVNTDGGLIANGEPIGASGPRQVPGTPRVGYAQLYGAPGTAGRLHHLHVITISSSRTDPPARQPSTIGAPQACC